MLMRPHYGRYLPAMLFVFTLLAGAAAELSRAQASQAAPPNTTAHLPTYEVVSIKPADPADQNPGWNNLPNGIDFKNMPLAGLIDSAYGIVLDSQISGLPAWVKTARYNVSVRADEDTAEAWKKLSDKDKWKQQQLMLQAMFVDRFQLKIQREVKVLPAYDLVIAKGGLKMKEAPLDEKELSYWKQTAFYGGANEGEYTITDTTNAGTTFALAQSLSHTVGRIIVDKTSLGDKPFDYELKWSSSGQAPPDGGDVGPTIFKALEEQLGLKLEPAKEPVDTFVVEQIERPSAN